MLLKNPDGPFVCIRSIIMYTAATFQGKRLLYSDLHIRGILQCLVVPNEPTLPQRRNCLDTLELLWLLAHIRHDGQLVAPTVALLGELVQYDVLHEVRLHEK